MAKYWIRGLYALAMTVVVAGALLYAVVYGIDRQAEISRFQIETEAQLCRDAWGVSNPPCAQVTIERLQPVPDPTMSGMGDVEASVLKRLPPVMPEEYPEPTIVVPDEESYYSPSPWPGEPATQQQKSPYVEWLERQRVPPSVMPTEEPTPYTPGSTNPARREEFRRRARPPVVPLHPGKVA